MYDLVVKVNFKSEILSGFHLVMILLIFKRAEKAFSGPRPSGQDRTFFSGKKYKNSKNVIFIFK